MTSVKERLIIENEELQFRLAEAEAALAAMHERRANDAGTPCTKGEQTCSIGSDETLFRSFIEEMDEGAVTLSGEGMIIYCNHRFAGFVGKPVEQVNGSDFRHFITPDDKVKITEALARQDRNVSNVLIVTLVNSVCLKLSFHILSTHFKEDNYILVATDISAIKKEQNKLLELSSLLERKLDLIQQLRLQLIEKKIQADVELEKLNRANRKLVREVARHKLAETVLKQKLKQKRGAG